MVEKDLLHKLVCEGLNQKTPVSKIMEESILAVDIYLTISDAGSLMQKYNINHLAVTKDDEIAGIVSIRDLAYKSKEPAQTY